MTKVERGLAAPESKASSADGDRALRSGPVGVGTVSLGSEGAISGVETAYLLLLGRRNFSRLVGDVGEANPDDAARTQETTRARQNKAKARYGEGGARMISFVIARATTKRTLCTYSKSKINVVAQPNPSTNSV